MFNLTIECEESDEKGAVATNKVIDEYNKRNRNKELKVDDTYKHCMTRKLRNT